MSTNSTAQLKRVVELLNDHYKAFYDAVAAARETRHPVPVDSRAWSQIIVSMLTGIKGLERKKGADLEGGSDVKAANTWEAIDTPRFNGVIKAGTKALVSGKLESLDGTPYIFLVLWDKRPTGVHRCRIWCVRPQHDKFFRKVCKTWYQQAEAGEITSSNFQLHPPRGKDNNIIRNKCGNLSYPLLLCAERAEDTYEVKTYHPYVLKTGACEKA